MTGRNTFALLGTTALLVGAMSSGLLAEPPAKQKDIVGVAVDAGSFKTLTAALKAADLVDTMKSKGPFTVFAPTDEAFAKLPEGTLESLLKPENRDKLVAILKYHVASDKITADKIASMKQVKTLNGQQLRIDTSKGVKVNDAKVVKADVEASNGVIHVIDHVLLPN